MAESSTSTSTPESNHTIISNADPLNAPDLFFLQERNGKNYVTNIIFFIHPQYIELFSEYYVVEFW